MGWILLMLLPGALTVYLAFNSGGVFPVTTANAALMVLTTVLVCLAVGRAPLAAPSFAGKLAIASFALFALWTLLSGRWSHAPGRALIAFDRVLLYLAILALFACVPRSLMRLRWLLRGLLAACAAVAVIGLLSRVLPSLWPTQPGLDQDRLSYPITYWNTFALLVGVGCVLALHHASDEQEPLLVRALAAALLPLLSATLLLTFSRGALAATVVAALLYVVVARPRGLPAALLALLPTTAVAVARTYSAELVHKGKPLTPNAITQAHHLALVLAACAILAALLRIGLAPLDARLRTLVIPAARRRALGLAAGAIAVVLLLLVLTAFHGASWAHHKYERFVDDTPDSSSVNSGERTRLSYVGNDGRLPIWKVALSAYRQDKLKGTGAGTFRLQWERHQHGPADRVYPYSLYLGALGELGLIGAVLLAVALLTILATLVVRARGPGRPANAAALALVIAWLIHSGLDLDWETPAVSVFAFALAGLALGPPGLRTAPGQQSVNIKRKGVLRARMRGRVRVRAAPFDLKSFIQPALALACLAIAIVPAHLALAQAHLQRSISALDVGDCAIANVQARAAIARLDDQPRPYEVLAMCAARQRHPQSAVRLARTAVARDPGYWEPRYVLALADATAGIDPRPAAAAAYVRRPQSVLAKLGLRSFNTNDPRRWKLAVRTLPFWFD